jgi:hypothetical protein
MSDEPNRVRGWKGIADVLNAQKYAHEGAFKAHKDLLPVFRDYLGPYADIGALEQWKARSVMAWVAYESVRRAG